MANILDKAEYSDLYKFLTSIGVLVIGLSILLPWLFLRDQLAVQVLAEEYNRMIPVSQQLTMTKLELTRAALSIVVVISPILFIVGSGLCWFGIRKWSTKQRGIDERDQLDLAERRAQVRPLDQSEYKAKAEEEVKSEKAEGPTAAEDQARISRVSDEVPEPNTPNSLASELIAVEEQLFDRIDSYNSFDYRVQRNVRLANRFEADILLAAYNSRQHIDRLIEIKYFQSRLSMDTVIAARDMLKKTRNYYNASTKRNVQAVLLLVYRTGVASDEELERFIQAVPQHQNPPVLTIRVLSDKEVPTFDIKSLLT